MNDVIPPAADASAAPEVPGAQPLPDAPARPGKARRILLTALPAVLVIGAVAGAAVYTKITVDGADRSVATTVYDVAEHRPGKDPADGTDRGRTDTELSKLLLPVPADYRLGPDVEELGNDGEVSGKEAAAAMKQSNRGLAGKQRREFDKRVDKLRVQGLAARSYVSDTNDLVVNTQIVRMKDKKAVRDLHTFRTELFDAVGVFREGPRIKGQTRNARCFLMPKDAKSEIENMLCSAYDGELGITVSAAGVKPIDKAAVAELLKDQLEHITSPGEYV
ncbi:hypothetical protein [Streptomyces sp. NBC_01341]|uniref:hypothetical protein n=1 Tax=Streptomyces sp. NBC_01341 TaxID=2903831 RepID=UPI002E10B635